MNNLCNVIDNVVIAPIEHPVKICYRLIDVLNPRDQVIHILVELLLQLLGADRLMNVRLVILHLPVILLHGVVRLVGHRRAVIILALVSARLLVRHLDLPVRPALVIASGLEKHVVDVGHQPILVLVEHAFVVLIVLVPLLGVSGVVLG